MAFGLVDCLIVAVSVLTVVSFGVYASYAKRGRSDSASDAYFLAQRSMPYYVVAASLFAANVGSEQFVGMAGTAAYSGIAVGIYELSAPYLLVLLGWVFAPLYVRCDLHTTPEYLERRFNKYCRLVFVSVLIATHIFSTITATLYAGSVVLEVFTGLSTWQSIPLVVLLTGLYTVTGGLQAVMLTDTLQCLIVLTGGVVGSVMALRLVGGVEGLFEKLEAVGLPEFPHLIRPLNDRDFPWLGTWMALFIGGMRYWCLDQEMAQRVLSAKNLHHARLGAAGAGLLKLLPLFIIIFPGMVARLLFELCGRNADDFSEWCETDLDESHESNKAYPLLVLHEFPTGMKGLMMAAFLAAMMSSLASLFNSVSAMFTYDIYLRFLSRANAMRPEAVARVGKAAVLGLVVLTLCWIPVVDSADRGLFLVASEVMNHLGPPIMAVFACGIFLKSVNAEGALIALIVGSLLGTIRLALFLAFQSTCDDYVHDHHQSHTGELDRLPEFHYFGPVLFSLTTAVILIASAFYPPSSEAQTEGHVVNFAVLTENCFSKSRNVYQRLSTITGTDTEPSVNREANLELDKRTVQNQGGVLSAVALPVIVAFAATGVIWYFR